MKLAALLLPILLLSGCAKTEGLTSLPDTGYLPVDVDVAALNEVINYESVNKYGQEITSISATKNTEREIKLLVRTGDADSLFTLQKLSGAWQIVEVQ